MTLSNRLALFVAPSSADSAFPLNIPKVERLRKFRALKPAISFWATNSAGLQSAMILRS